MSNIHAIIREGYRIAPHANEKWHISGKISLKIALNARDHFFFFYNGFSYPMFRYLRRDHIQHCVLSNVSSGLATLPLSFVYVNNTAIKSRPTNKSLPTGELLNGKKSYQQIVSYFTTNTMSPDDIHDLGFKMLKELYPQVGDGILKFVIMNCWNWYF